MQMRTVGSVGALVFGLLFVVLIVLLAVVLPGQGLGPGTLYAPASGVPFIENSSLPALIAFIYIGISVGIVLIVFALYERLSAANPALMLLVAAASVVASSLFLGYAMIDLTGNPHVVSAYRDDPILGGAVYVALRTAGNALNAGALFATGLAIGFVGWVARSTNRLPKPLSYLLIVAGAATTLSFIVLPLGLVAVLLAPIWSIWLGVLLWRSP